jgi:hypothetical protein
LVSFPFMKRLLIAVAVCGLCAPARGEESKTWQQFVEAKRNGTEPILPDFSYAGYHGGGEAIPDVGGPVFDVTRYGAKGDGNADDQEAIQKAIDAAEAAGGGVVFFPPGTFRVNADLAHRRPIRVTAGHIVLRGSGATRGGTVILVDEPTLKIPAAKRAGAGHAAAAQSGGQSGGEVAPEWMFRIGPATTPNGRQLARIIGDTRREDFVLSVDDASRIQPGMWVTLSVQGKAVVPGVIAPYKISDLPAEWTRIHKGISLQEHHRVAAVNGKRVTLREPVKTSIAAQHGWTLRECPSIAEIGIEDICFEGSWLGKFVHHRSVMDDAGWAGVKMFHVTDSWVRRCAFINFNACLGAESCAYSSVMQIVLAGTMGHVSIDDHRRSTGMFFGLMVDRLEHQPGLRDTTHGIGAAGSASASVFWRYEMQPEESFDMHGMYPYATLFDCVEGGNLAGSGGPVPSFPNHMQHFVAWNFNQRKAPARFANGKHEYDFWGGRPSLVMPILVGMHGQMSPINLKTVSIYESPGRPVDPPSLFEAQLALWHGGKCPAWVAKAKADWARMNKNLPDFPRGGDNTSWVAKKRWETIDLILRTPMLAEKFDKTDPKGQLARQWPTSNGVSWVAPGP